MATDETASCFAASIRAWKRLAATELTHFRYTIASSRLWVASKFARFDANGSQMLSLPDLELTLSDDEI
jgi:hypothetical protein